MSESAGTRPLRRSVLLAFVLPSVVLGIMHGPEGQIQAVYAKHAGLSLSALAMAILFTRLFDGITYPLIGYLSDRSYARSGTRRNWVLAGGALSVVGIWFLLRPPPQVTIWYFGIWSAVTYLGWKVIEIPLQAWSYGLSADYGQRARVQAWRAFAMISGPMLFFMTPFLAMKLGYSDSTELDFRTLGFAAVICAWALPLATAILVLRVHAGQAAPPAVRRERFSARDVLAALRGNKPLLRLLAAFLPFNVLGQMSAGVSYLYIDTYLGLSEQSPAIMMVSLLATALGIPFWSAMAARYERHRVWAVSLICCGTALGSTALLSPGALALPFMFVLYPIGTFGLIGYVIVLTMSADIVDYGRFHTGQDHGGLYGSMVAFLQKSMMSVAVAAGIGLVGLFGFDATAKLQSVGGVVGIKLVSAILPALGLFGSALIIWNYPLTRARTEEIQRALAERDRQAAGQQLRSPN
ncbi:MAG TPA: MFS transporter [Fontimonas sp.]